MQLVCLEDENKHVASKKNCTLCIWCKIQVDTSSKIPYAQQLDRCYLLGAFAITVYQTIYTQCDSVCRAVLTFCICFFPQFFFHRHIEGEMCYFRFKAGASLLPATHLFFQICIRTPDNCLFNFFNVSLSTMHRVLVHRWCVINNAPLFMPLHGLMMCKNHDLQIIR